MRGWVWFPIATLPEGVPRVTEPALPPAGYSHPSQRRARRCSGRSRDVRGGSPSSRPRGGRPAAPPLSRCRAGERRVPLGPPYYRCGLGRERLHVSHRRSGIAAGRAPHRARLDRTGSPLHRVRSPALGERRPLPGVGESAEAVGAVVVPPPPLRWGPQARGLTAPPASSWWVPQGSPQHR